MNKNPFVATAYTPQPPLPPGPPPPQPAQPDYSAYWAAAQQQSAVTAYAAQWNAAAQAAQATGSQPANQTASALYANYGYGGQNASWQQQQRPQQQQQQQPQHYQPPPPVAQPPPPPPPQPQHQPQHQVQAPAQPQAQPQYNVYQPQSASFQQPFVHQATPQAIPQSSFAQQPPTVTAQPYQQPQQYFGQPQQQQNRQNRPHPGHHGSPQQFPPAKRQRFDGPPQHQPPLQPQFQAPPPPQVQEGPVYNQNPGYRGRGGMNPGPRGGFVPNRGGNMGMRGRGAPMVARGDRGRGRGTYNNMGGRGGSMNQPNGSFRGRGTGRGFNRGGSFNSGYSYGSQQHGGQPYQPHHQYQNQYHQNQYHQNQYGYNNSFRGRGRGRGFYQSSHGGHHDGGSVASVRDGGSVVSASFSSGKKDENRRTLTDFKIVGLTIPELGWSWGATPGSVDVTASAESSDQVASVTETEGGAAADNANIAAKAEPSVTIIPPPPSRLRIYFHTPVSPDDSRPISGSYASASAVRKGKRKKLEDDDGDYEDERGGPPPPNGSGFTADGRESASVVSEADWLMQAIGDDEGDGDGGENLHVSEVDNYLGEGDDEYGNGDEYLEGDGDEGDHEMGANDTQGYEGPEGEFNEDHDGTDHPAVNGFAGAPHEGGDAPAASEGGSHDPNSQITPPSVSPHPSASSEPAIAAPSSTQADDPSQTADASSAPPASLHNSTPLQATDSIATVADSTQEDPSPYASTVLVDEGDQASQELVATQLIDDSASASAEAGNPAGANGTGVKGEKTPSANRLSVAFAGGTRRLVIDAEVVQSLKIFRSEGRIEVILSIASDERGGLKGIVLEGFSETTSTYMTLEMSQADTDVTVPPLSKAKVPSNLLMTVFLDRDRPLSEPRWVRTGDVQEWLKSMFGRMFWVAGDAADGWEKRIHIVDPDPSPTIWTQLESWAANSNVGVPTERQRFLRTHMVETDNVLEILLRLVRGERSTFTQNQPLSAPTVTGPLLAAVSQDSIHAAAQTHVSLAVLAIFRLATDYATKASGDQGKSEAEDRVGEIIRALPSHLLYKSLDGIFKEWRAEKKGAGK